MPLYEHACQPRFEVLQCMGADASGVSRPSCGGSQVAREISTFAAATGPAGCACHSGRRSCP